MKTKIYTQKHEKLKENSGDTSKNDDFTYKMMMAKKTNKVEELNNNFDLFNEQAILKELNLFYGSEKFYKDYMNCVYTEGFKTFLDLNKCYWLFSDIAVIVMMNFLNKEDFIFCKFKVNEDKSCFYELYSDYVEGNQEFNKKHLLYTQKYEFTDSIIRNFEFYIVHNEINTFTFMLKREY
jgi:hypothetical protein